MAITIITTNYKDHCEFTTFCELQITTVSTIVKITTNYKDHCEVWRTFEKCLIYLIIDCESVFFPYSSQKNRGKSNNGL